MPSRQITARLNESGQFHLDELLEQYQGDTTKVIHAALAHLYHKHFPVAIVGGIQTTIPGDDGQPHTIIFYKDGTFRTSYPD